MIAGNRNMNELCREGERQAAGNGNELCREGGIGMAEHGMGHQVGRRKLRELNRVILVHPNFQIFI